MRKLTNKGICKKLTDLVREKVLLRDQRVCQHCGKVLSGKNCHLSHVVPKSHGNALRWDENNLMVLCFHCHIDWWHAFPTESGNWFINKFPERFKYLEAHKNDLLKRRELSGLYETLKNAQD